MATWAEKSLEKAGAIYYAGPAYFFVTPQEIGITPYRAEIPPNAQVLSIICQVRTIIEVWKPVFIYLMEMVLKIIE